MNNRTFTALAGITLAVAAIGGWQFLGSSATCESLAGAAPTDDIRRHTLAIELAGNTDAWADEVSGFVRRELRTSQRDSPQTPVVVDVLLSRDGRISAPVTKCLRGQLLLTPAERDLVAYDGGSDETRKVMLRNMLASREDQIDILAATFAAEVSTTIFGSEVGPTLSVLPVWAAAAAGNLSTSDRAVSILSPLFSTAKDCLDPSTGSNVTPTDLVKGCVQFNQMPVLPGHVRIDYVHALASTAGQRAVAEETVKALCAVATTDGCMNDAAERTNASG